MKYILFFLVCFFINTVTANNFDNYQNHISANRLIVFFQENISEQEKEATFRLTGIGKNYTNLPAPKLSICFTDNFPLAKKYLESLPQVKAVSFFLTDGKENYAGVLNTFFVKLKDKNFEPLLKNKLVQMQQSEAVRDKYIPNLYKIENHQAKTKNTIDGFEAV